MTSINNLYRELQEGSESTPRLTEDTSSSIAGPILSNMCLFCLIYGISANVQVKKVKKQIRNKCALLTGVGMQFLIMPLLGYAAVSLFQGLTPAMGFSLLVVTSSPGGSYSNWWCALFNADLALSVAMTTVSTILSMGMLPANLLLYNFLAYGITGNGAEEDETGVLQALDFGALAVSLGVVLSAVVTGLYSSYKMEGNKTFRTWTSRLASLSGIGLMVVSAVFSVAGGVSLANFSWTFYVGVSFPCFIGIFLATIVTKSIPKITPPESMSIAIECCYQNTGIALSVAMSMFPDDVEKRTEALAVALLYSAVEAFVIGIYCLIAWKSNWTKAPANENFCVVITNTYEILEGEDKESKENEEDFHDEEENRDTSQAPSSSSSFKGKARVGPVDEDEEVASLDLSSSRTLKRLASG